MNALWQCAVCETVNNGGRSCTACGAAMTRRSAAVTAVRSRIAQAPPPPPPTRPLPDPVRRAINREPVDDEEWPYDEHSFTVMPLPGGCLFTVRPRRFGP